MKKICEQYPEVILADATHKTSDLRMPLMLVIDSNGESEIVAAFVVVNEEDTSHHDQHIQKSDSQLK